MKFESESQLSVRCFKCGCFGHRGLQCAKYSSDGRSQCSSAGALPKKCWICGCLGHIAAECLAKTVTCFSCGQRGHKQADCTSPMANCWNCGMKGHIKKDCPIKKNVGMCFYCHQVGHHSKDCDQKVCYHCESKDHLWTRCPFRGAQNRQPFINPYVRRMRQLQPGQDYQKAFQQEQFSNRLFFDNRYSSPIGHELEIPSGIRKKSVPLLSQKDKTIAHRRPMPIRSTSDPIGYSASFGLSLEHSKPSKSMDDFQLINHSSLSSITPNLGSMGLRSDEDRSGISMLDLYSRSDESSMKVTESEKDGSFLMPSLDDLCKSPIQSAIAGWKKDISREPEADLPPWGSSKVWWDNGLRVELSNLEVGSLTNTQSEKQTVTSGSECSDPSNDDKKENGAITREIGSEGERLPVQDQHTLKCAEEAQIKSSNVSDVRDVSGASTTVEIISNFINTINSSSTITSTCNEGYDAHLSESTMSRGKEEDVKTPTVKGFVPEATIKTPNSAELSKTEAQIEIEAQESEVYEELKSVRKQLAEAQTKLDAKEKELDTSHKMVEALKKVIFLGSAVKKEVLFEKCEQSTKTEIICNKFPNTPTNLKKLKI